MDLLSVNSQARTDWRDVHRDTLERIVARKPPTARERKALLKAYLKQRHHARLKVIVKNGHCRAFYIFDGGV
ncbi:hypothetical protein JQ615_38860 [Bradyrhizobium jicamae]|uniref:Cyclic nucleotide-binding domain-containing protein n=1 Tax=Bradyrhizobium jicamae TaxID=280332 RepID=A0ABS5FX78_9BRAD|nr:hypothetical protein [Bradyrhizobium jicamae]MBR0801325.1 hypothetical protein [Bradyrhizobium jicamae]